MLISKIRGDFNKLFCLYKLDGGMIGRLELIPNCDDTIIVGGAIHVGIRLVDTADQLPDFECGKHVSITGMGLPLRGMEEASIRDNWHILDFDWNVYEVEMMEWPSIWKESS